MTAEDPADLAIQIMANQRKRQYLVNKLLYNLFDDQHNKEEHYLPCMTWRDVKRDAVFKD